MRAGVGWVGYSRVDSRGRCVFVKIKLTRNKFFIKLLEG